MIVSRGTHISYPLGIKTIFNLKEEVALPGALPRGAGPRGRDAKLRLCLRRDGALRRSPKTLPVVVDYGRRC